MDTATPPSRHPGAPDGRSRMHPWTLEFIDAELESRYRGDIRRQTGRIMRFGMLLAIALFSLFGFFDASFGAERLAYTIALRMLVVAVAASIILFSYTRAFDRYREPALLSFCVLMAVALSAITIAGGETIADRYYAGYILIVIASYLIMGVSFVNGTFASVLAFGLYLSTEYVFFGGFDLDAASDSVFLLSAIAVAAVGAYSISKQRRLAYCHGLALERERVASRHSALHDPLTGLPNRRLLMEKLAQAVARDQRFRTFAAVLFIDLDAFKPVNDQRGHAFGDKLLKAVAARLLDCVRATDTVARMGGDEFVVLLEDLGDEEAAVLFIDRLLTTFAQPCVVDDVHVPVDLSIGCALHPRDGDTPRKLLEIADEAMYRMKRRMGRR